MDGDAQKNENQSGGMPDRFTELAKRVERATYRDDTEAPPVEDDLLRRYLERRVTVEEDARVDTLLEMYRPWADALSQVEREIGYTNPNDFTPTGR